jgi:DNA-binding transcriptional regulator YdaS (Cro superfamily)
MIASMRKDEVLDFFGGATAAAHALGVSQPSVSSWGEQIPELRQLQIERLTGGVLRAGPECDPYRVPIEPSVEGFKSHRLMVDALREREKSDAAQNTKVSKESK